MITIETIRDLSYRGERDLMLSIYRDMSRIKDLGLEVDETLYKYIGQRLKTVMGLWLAGCWCKNAPDYDNCKSIMAMKPKPLKMLRRIIDNKDNQVEHLVYGEDGFHGVEIYLKVPEKWSKKGTVSQLIISIGDGDTHIGILAMVDDYLGEDSLYLAEYDFHAKGFIDTMRSVIEEAFGSLGNFFDYMNHVLPGSLGKKAMKSLER